MSLSTLQDVGTNFCPPTGLVGLVVIVSAEIVIFYEKAKYGKTAIASLKRSLSQLYKVVKNEKSQRRTPAEPSPKGEAASPGGEGDRQGKVNRSPTSKLWWHLLL